MSLQSIEQSEDGTIKLNYEQGYSAIIIPSKDNKKTLCLSSQIGCIMKCKFCLSGKTNFERNLSSDEILEQFFDSLEYLNAKSIISSNNVQGETYAKDIITSIVFMGMGEPLNNLKNVITSIERLHYNYHYPLKKINISTSGIIPRMREIINHPLKIQLSLSLHSPHQDTRNKIMPSLKSYKIEELLEICKEYNEKHKQKIMIEYLMINGLTDTQEDLDKLIEYNFANLTNFNLIQLNVPFELEDKKYITSPIERFEHFKTELMNVGYKCFIRESMGKDISAACGMLRKK